MLYLATKATVSAILRQHRQVLRRCSLNACEAGARSTLPALNQRFGGSVLRLRNRQTAQSWFWRWPHSGPPGD
jgi:hypothetical protein